MEHTHSILIGMMSIAMYYMAVQIGKLRRSLTTYQESLHNLSMELNLLEEAHLDTISDVVELQDCVDHINPRLDKAEELIPILQEIKNSFEGVHRLEGCVIVDDAILTEDITQIKRNIKELKSTNHYLKSSIEGDGK